MRVTSKYIYIFLTMIILTLCSYVAILNINNSSLKATISNLQSDIVVCNTNKKILEQSIEVQNKKIEEHKSYSKDTLDKYLELSSKPPEVRHKIIYKQIPTIEVKSNECEDIKKLIDDIRINGY